MHRSSQRRRVSFTLHDSEEHSDAPRASREEEVQPESSSSHSSPRAEVIASRPSETKKARPHRLAFFMTSIQNPKIQPHKTKKPGLHLAFFAISKSKRNSGLAGLRSRFRKETYCIDTEADGSEASIIGICAASAMPPLPFLRR